MKEIEGITKASGRKMERRQIEGWQIDGRWKKYGRQLE